MKIIFLIIIVFLVVGSFIAYDSLKEDGEEIKFKDPLSIERLNVHKIVSNAIHKNKTMEIND